MQRIILAITSGVEPDEMYWGNFFYAVWIRCSLAVLSRRKDFAFHVKRQTHDWTFKLNSIQSLMPLFLTSVAPISQAANFTSAEFNSKINCTRDATSESVEFDSFKLNTTLPNLPLKQSKIRLRFDIWFRRRISHVQNIMHYVRKCYPSLDNERTAIKFDTIISEVWINCRM